MKNIYTYQTQSEAIEIRCLDEGLFRIRASKAEVFYESLLSRYNILKETQKDIPVSFDGKTLKSERFSLSLEGNTLRFTGEGHDLSLSLAGRDGGAYSGMGFRLSMPLCEDERLLAEITIHSPGLATFT